MRMIIANCYNKYNILLFQCQEKKLTSIHAIDVSKRFTRNGKKFLPEVNY